MIKVLKSFDSAHSAVNWMTQNRIEDTSIETTGTLKSMGMGGIPSGNYHVVLKSRPFLSRVGGAINPANWVSAIRNRGTEFDPNDATDILSRVAQDRAAGAASGKGHTPLSIKVPTETIGGRDAVRKISPSRIRPEGESIEAGAVRTFDTDLINPTHLGTDIQDMAGRTGRKINQDTANRLNESVGLNLTSREQDRLAGEMGIARRKKGTGDTLTQSISRENLVNIITKSVIDVLKSEEDDFRARFQRANEAAGPRQNAFGSDTPTVFDVQQRAVERIFQAGGQGATDLHALRDAIEQRKSPEEIRALQGRAWGHIIRHQKDTGEIE
jgi:hypothetical protein